MARERGENFLVKHGNSVEKLLEPGWGVARIFESAFTSRGFQVSAADATGHCDVTGERALFETYRNELAQEAKLVPIDEYEETP